MNNGINYELKPCPFCGGKAKLKDNTDVMYGYPGYLIVCKCGCKFFGAVPFRLKEVDGRLVSYCDDSQKTAARERTIQKWNRRVDDDK